MGKDSLRRIIVAAIAALLGMPCLAYEQEVQALSVTMAEQIAASGKKTVAVVDFTDLQGNVTELGRFLAEEFSTALAGSGKGFEVIDRNNLKTILQEHKLATTGIIDPATAKRLGQIAGVDALITGTMTPFGESVRIAIKILDTSTARIVGAARGEIPKTKAIEQLLSQSLGDTAGSQRQPSHAESPVDQRESTRGTEGQQAKPAPVEEKDFVFEAKECRRAGRKLTCSLVVKNVAGGEQELGIGGRGYTCAEASYLYDNLGNQYVAIQVQLGAKQDEQNAWQHLPPQLPIVARLTFQDVAAEARYCSLRIGATNANCNRFFPTIRNVPLL